MQSICRKERRIYPGVLCQCHSAEEKCHLIACLLESKPSGCIAKKNTSCHLFGSDTELQYWTAHGVMTVAGRLLINSSAPGLMSKHTTCRGFWDNRILFLRCNFLFFFPNSCCGREGAEISQYSVNTEDKAITPLYKEFTCCFFSLCESVKSHYRRTEAVNVSQNTAAFSKQNRW